MQFAQNKSLKAYNTFGIDVKAKRFVSIGSEEELEQILRKTYASELFVLGGGSNMLLTKDLDKTVAHIDLKGKQVLETEENSVLVSAKAGENWHEFVLWCLENGFGGVENLSLIPGNVGTAPIQNIGAYGVELKDVFVECKALNIQTLQTKTFSKEDCRFGYRDSVFKNELKNQFIITEVIFRLTTKNHQLHTSYGAIQHQLELVRIVNPTIRDISNAVVKIRQEKLPDPNKIGNSGSFFKNPIVPKSEFEQIQKKHPEIPFYALPDGRVKIPAGWLIDQAGFKGFRDGDAGVHKNQALVLVNHGNATGTEILSLAEKIREKIADSYGVMLEFEVNVF
ncbi:MAG TPA: UDP-N-acetylmuramate dehydrogenase [Flavobacteriaceae bacterium]|nr:UDP-N-acetylmuramate dehydrogenase [Flavobacteriaceae bacterium]